MPGMPCKRDELLLRFKKTDLKACATLTRDEGCLVTFFDYPREHWLHIIESLLSAVRLRTDAARRFKKIENRQGKPPESFYTPLDTISAKQRVLRGRCTAARAWWALVRRLSEWTTASSRSRSPN